MELALNQIRKDVRQFRYILYALVVLLFLDLASNQGWTSRVDWQWPFDYSDLSRTSFRWIGALIGLAFVLTVSCFYGNSRHRENAFLCTRPCPGSSIWLGNILFVSAFVVVPLILTETVNLWLHGLPAELVLAGTWERATLVVPLVVIVATAIVTAQSNKAIAVFIAAAYGIGIIGVGVGAMVAELFPEVFGHRTLTTTGVRFGIAVCAVLMTIRCVWFLHARPGAVVRWITIVVIIFGSEWAVFLGPQDRPLRGVAEAEVKDAMAKVETELPLNSLAASLGEIQGGIVRMGWNPSPKLNGKPEGWFVRWGACNGVLETADGRSYAAGPYPGATRVFRRFSQLTQSEMNAVVAELPEDVIVENVGGGFSDRRAMGYRLYDLPEDGDWWDQPAKLTVAGEGLAYRWALAAELKIERGEEAKDGLSQWKILGTAVNKTQNHVELVVEQAGPGLAMTDQADLIQRERWPIHRHEFILYDPELRVGVSLANRYVNSGKIGGHTAFQRHTGILRFEQRHIRQDGWLNHPDKLRLLVFRLDYLGSFEKAVSTQVIPATFRNFFHHDDHIDVDRISVEEYRRKIAELKEPAPDASRTEVGNYAFALLQLAESHRTYGRSDPVVQRLEKLVPHHIEMFFEGLQVGRSTANRALENALVNGIQPEQKQVLIDRLWRQPQLASVLVKRGWIEDARDEILALIDRDQNLPSDMLRALAWYDEPRADDRLIAELRSANGSSVYRIISGLPRLRERIDEAIDDIWAGRKHSYRSSSMMDRAVILAAKHGKIEAIDRIARLMRLRNRDYGSVDHTAVQLMGEMVELPGISSRDRLNSEKIVDAVQALNEDVKFEFDPVLRKYRIIEGGAE